MLTIQDKPIANEAVQIKIRRHGEVAHKSGEVHARFARQPLRKQIAERIRVKDNVDYYYEECAKLSKKAKSGGNIYSVKTLGVLRKIKSEDNLTGRLHCDMIQETILCKRILNEVEPKGFVQVLGAAGSFPVHFVHRRAAKATL